MNLELSLVMNSIIYEFSAIVKAIIHLKRQWHSIERHALQAEHCIK